MGTKDEQINAKRETLRNIDQLPTTAINHSIRAACCYRDSKRWATLEGRRTIRQIEGELQILEYKANRPTRGKDKSPRRRRTASGLVEYHEYVLQRCGKKIVAHIAGKDPAEAAEIVENIFAYLEAEDKIKRMAH